jgi:site-specific DNA-methyltransferase (adenine-specific)
MMPADQREPEPPRILHGDCRERLRELPDDSIDALVSDPPSGIGFLGMAWDGDHGGRDAWIGWLTEILIECRRVLKPGAQMLLWALPRTSHWTATALEDAGFEIRDVISHVTGTGFPHARNLDGRATGLKPASEHWILARRPLREKNVSLNLEAWQTGALNIDACRVNGRYPSNFLLSIEEGRPYAPYFYCAKATKQEKNEGLDDFPWVRAPSVNARLEKRASQTRNPHPTVKPLRLMRYLCRLITPPGGTVLDVFCGSGSTGVAALQEGLSFVGIEQDAAYVEIARARWIYAQEHPDLQNRLFADLG